MGQQTDWPELRSGLTAPEWHVLNYAGHSEGRESFKVAVKELVARGVLQVEPIEARTWHRSRTLLSALVEGPRFGTTPAPPLAPVLDVFAGATKRTLQAAEESARGRRPIEGVSTDSFARAARRHFRRQLNRYRDRHVLPALVERGLMTAERGPLGTRKGWTDAGRQAVDDLGAWSEVGRTRMGQWLAEIPRRRSRTRRAPGPRCS